MRVPFYLHDINDEDIDNVTKVLKSPFLSTGDITYEFENKFAGFFNVKHAIGTTNWTSAAELTLKLWGIQENDEVIIPAMSYCATAHVVRLNKATPVFVDSDPLTGLIDINLIEKAITEKTKAIIPVHLYGVMADMFAINKIAKKYKLKVLEDAAHATISSRDNIYPGQLSDAAIFSFYATKPITSGEGGVLITNDDGFAKRFRMATRCGTNKSAYERQISAKKYMSYDSMFVSGKCNMTNISAALLLSQLDRILDNRRKRKKLVNKYCEALKDIEWLKIPNIPDGCNSSYSLFVILVKNRSVILKKLAEKMVGTAINYIPIYELSAYSSYKPFCPIAEQWGKECISLPLYVSLTEDSIDYIADSLKQVNNPALSLEAL